MFTRSSLRVLAVLPVLFAVQIASGCGGGATSAPTSKIVSADSEEGKKAQADDEAVRQLRRQQEAKAASRKRGLKLPDEG